MGGSKIIKEERVSTAGKNAEGKAWYKNRIDLLDTNSTKDFVGINGLSEAERMQINFDLFNNVLPPGDLDKVCGDFLSVGDLPAELVNQDILSNKIKVVVGLEMRSPFECAIVATNPEATTRKETKENDLLKEFVINKIMLPIRQEQEAKMMQETQGRELSEQETQELQARMEEELEAMTPPEVKKYMARTHQDPAEHQISQLLSFLSKKKKLKQKFSKGTKYAALVAREFYWVGEVNGEPDVLVLNPKYLKYDLSPDQDGIQHGDFATYEHHWTPSKIVSFFSDELTTKEIDEIYSENRARSGKSIGQFHHGMPTENYEFDFDNPVGDSYDDNRENTSRVLQTAFRALTKVCFLTYIDLETEEEKVMLVDENYDLNPELGDIEIEIKYLPEVYEGWKIGANIYKRMRPVPGQFKDIDNIHNCPLPFYGDLYDATNSRPTSLFDRGLEFQRTNNLIYFRLKMLMASDKGKKVLMNINAIPDSLEIDIDKFQYFFESTPFGWFNPNEEGMQYSDVNTIAKVIDLSTASDMAKYSEFADKVDIDCGKAMGVSRQMEAQMGQREAVGNVQQAIAQGSIILEPFFDMHSNIRNDVTEAFLNCARVVYRNKPKQYLYNVLDDMSVEKFMLDPELLDMSSYGLFVMNASKSQEIKEQLTQLAHAAMQTQKASLADIMVVLKEDSLIAAEERLRLSEAEAEERLNKMERERLESAEKVEKIISDREKAKQQHEKDLAVLKEEERRKTVVVQAAITGMSFNPELDADSDGVNDFLEIARDGVDADIKKAAQQLKREEFEHKKLVDTKNLELQDKKITVDAAKNAQKMKI